MYTRRITLWLLVCISAIPLTVCAGDLTMTMRTDKSSYEFAEPIVLTVEISNNSADTYVLSTTPFERPGRMLFRATSPTGARVRSQRRYGRSDADRRPPTITLGPGDSHAVTYDLMQHYPDMHVVGGPHHNLDEPGMYELSATYHLKYGQRWAHHYEGIFVGSLESEPVRFDVKPLQGARLEQLVEQLSEENVAAKVEALSLLRRGRAVNRMPNLLHFLNEDQPRALRIEAARAIYDAPDPNAWQVYTEFLDDPVLCGFMAVALGKLGNKAAGDALYAVTDPEKYPRSYWLAFKALVKIGDPRAREVAALLKESAESPAFREMASKVLREQAGE